MKRRKPRVPTVGELEEQLAACDRLRLKPAKKYEVRPVSEEERLANPDDYILVAGSRAWALRCSAQSKRAKRRCLNPAMQGMKVCKWHGARGGPKTAAGLQKCAEVATVHGNNTRQSRRDARAERASLKVLSRAVDALVASGGSRVTGAR